MSIVSGIWQSDSVIHIHIFIHFQILYPHRLLQNIEYTSPYAIQWVLDGYLSYI